MLDIQRRKGIRISPKEVLELIKEHYKIVYDETEEFPDDMEYAGATYDFDSNSFCIKVLSGTYKKVSDGELMTYYGVERK